MQSPDAGRSARLRRARREDLPALVGVVGGPAPGRARALRRILKTLAADIYVLDRDRRIDGVVAVFYRRSLHEGGLVAIIDALESFTEGGEDEGAARGADVESLLEHAIERARKRGCVAVHAATDAVPLQGALGDRGFLAGPSHLVRTLVPTGETREDVHEEEGGEG